jgi:hypothetical protein
MARPLPHRIFPARRLLWLLSCLAHTAIAASAAAQTASEPLPSWNDGPSRRSIIAFVEESTRQGGPRFVPPAARIAVFDNDGTLWTEQPMYVQAVFMLDRLRAFAAHHPELLSQTAVKTALAGNPRSLSEPPRELMEILAAAQPGSTTQEYERAVLDWLATARHPRFNRPYTELVYQPMLELLEYLRAHEFKTYIVSGGGNDFLRPWAWQVYGVPPEQIIGSGVKIKYDHIRDTIPVLIRQPKIAFVDDHEGKPIAIHQIIGRRPIFAIGNSDGDQQMLEWTDAGENPRLMLLVHHDDCEREYCYDRKSKVGKLDTALNEAHARDWSVVSMKNDWRVIYPFQRGTGVASGR